MIKNVWLQAPGVYFLSELGPPTPSTLELVLGAEQAQQSSPAHAEATV